MKITEWAKIQITANDVGGYCVALLLVSIYFSTALAIAFSVVVAMLWIASGQYKHLPRTLKNCPVALWSLLLFGCFIIGASYGDATSSDAIGMLKKYRELLFLPLILPLLAEARYRRWVWNAFIIASIITLLGSQLMSIQVFCVEAQCLPYFKSHITHGIVIAFFAFFVMHKVFDTRQELQMLCLATLLLCLYNLFFVSAGRTGQLIFVCLSLVFAVQRLSKKGLLLAVLIMAMLIGGFLTFSDKATRIKEGVATLESRLQGHSQEGEYSMGERFNFWKYSAQLMAEKPLFGQGTGNYTKAYQRVSGKESFNPHNEFFLIGVQLGAVGLLFYLGFLGSQFYYARTLPEHDKWLAQGLLVTLVTTSLFNSPLLDHTEGHWFTVMIALCFAARVTKAETGVQA